MPLSSTKRWFPNLSGVFWIGIILSIPLLYASAEEASKPKSEFDVVEQANQLYLQLPAQGSTNSLLEEQVKRQWGYSRTTQSLDTCMTASHWHGFSEKDDNNLSNAVDILTRIEMYKYYLQRLGIPRQVWEDKTNKMRQVALAIYTGSYSEELKTSVSRRIPAINWQDRQMTIEALGVYATHTLRIDMLKALEEYSLRTNGKYHFLPKRGGCGGPNPVLIMKTTPPGAEVYIIPEFRYLLCQGKGYDPYDRIKCNGWQLSQDGRMNLVGRWHYSAKWPDGSESKGPFRISNPDNNSFTLTKTK